MILDVFIAPCLWLKALYNNSLETSYRIPDMSSQVQSNEAKNLPTYALCFWSKVPYNDSGEKKNKVTAYQT